MLAEISPTPDRWFIVQTVPGRDLAAARLLEARAFRVYAPIVWKTINAKETPRPLIPGYLFVASDAFVIVQGTPGVRDFLRVEGNPAWLPDRILDVLRAQERHIEDLRQYHIMCRSKQLHDFKVGQRIRLVYGAVAGLFSKVEALDGLHKIKILLNMFGRPVCTIVRPFEIEAA